MKKILMLSLVLMFFAFTMTALASQPQVPADGYKMDKNSKLVIFNHSTHTDYTCVECHHPVNGVEDYRPCSTPECHDLLDRKDKTVRSYYQAMHKARDVKFDTCVSCHSKVAGNDRAKKKELASCVKSACHP